MSGFSKKDYTIERITPYVLNSYVTRLHYLHRAVPVSYAYGLRENASNVIVGVVSYGQPASHSVMVGLFGKDEIGSIIELNRLFVFDCVPRNAGSFLISNTVRLLPYEVVISYADSSVGHTGYVYQASNWMYYGMSDRHVEWHVDGVGGSHSRHMFDQYGGINKAKEVLGDRMTAHERPRKHRYMWINARGERLRELLSKFRYEFLPYPKNGAIINTGG